jgi:hypothetical protein
MMAEEECKHGMLPMTCEICLAPRAPGRRGVSRRGTPDELDSPASVEKYRSRYPGDREPTFQAYVAVFFGFADARNFPGGWTKFSRCANAEPALAREQPRLVERAERIMRDAGYVPDDSNRNRGGGRMWHREGD